MSTRALRIWEHGEVEAIQLPDTHAAQIRELAYLVGGPTDTGVYHRPAVLHIHGTGSAAQDLQFNAAAWALASAWRGVNFSDGRRPFRRSPVWWPPPDSRS